MYRMLRPYIVDRQVCSCAFVAVMLHLAPAKSLAVEPTDSKWCRAICGGAWDVTSPYEKDVSGGLSHACTSSSGRKRSTNSLNMGSVMEKKEINQVNPSAEIVTRSIDGRVHSTAGVVLTIGRRSLGWAPVGWGALIRLPIPTAPKFLAEPRGQAATSFLPPPKPS